MPTEPGEIRRSPTLRDIALAAQVSVATVSNVLNPESVKYVSPGVRQRVQSAAEALGYRPNLLARGMRGKGRRTLAILVPQFENLFFTRLVMGAERAAHEHGYVLLICSTYDDPDRERFYVERLVSQQVDGFFLSPTLKGGENTRILRKRGIPYVVVDRRLVEPEGPYDYVGFSHWEGAFLATEHLIRLGHRRLGFIGWQTEIPVIRERLEGFRAALRAYGLGPGACPVREGPHTRAEGERLGRELLEREPVTALFAAHQYQAEGIVLVARRLGRRIPRDVSLVVYGRPTWTELVDPPLVCVDMPAEQIGERAVQTLLERVNGRRREPVELLLPPRLTEGASVADVTSDERTAEQGQTTVQELQERSNRT